MSQAYRLATTYQFAPPAIDRSAGVLRGITAMQAGIEALGHGVQADMQTLHLLAGMGNADPDGIRTRFGHPGISENATGKKVANATNFRVQNDRLLHDSRLLESARKSPVFSQDPLEYILEMAEKTPKELGESVVIAANTVWALADGREVNVVVWGPGSYEYPDGLPDDVELDKNGRPLTATTPLPVLRPVDFHFVDFVGEPALVRDGLTPMEADAINYLFGGRASEYAQEMFRIVDEWRQRYHVPLQAIPGKVDQIVSEYMAARSGRSTEMARKMKFEDAGEPVTNPATEAQPEADPVEEALQEAEQATAQATEEPAQNDELAALWEHVRNLQDANARKDEQIERLSRALTAHAKTLEVVKRNIARIDGEAHVSESVPKGRPQPLERYDDAMTFAHPAPRYQMSTPTHVTERQPDPAGVLPTDDPRTAAAKRNMARSRQIRANGGQQ